MLEERSRRPLSMWRLAVLKALEKRQRRTALNLVLEKNRRKAYRNGWRRLWDGEGGEPRCIRDARVCCLCRAACHWRVVRRAENAICLARTSASA